MGYLNYKPPLLHRGWTLVPKALLEWGVANGFETTRRFHSGPDKPVIEEPNSLWTVTQPEVLKDLAKKAGTPHLRPAFKLSMRSKGFRLITISTNYSFLKDKKTISLKRIETFGQYLKEWGIVEDAPGWHLDYEHYMWRRIYWRFLPAVICVRIGFLGVSQGTLDALSLKRHHNTSKMTHMTRTY
jgi:hypothetical protein